MRDSAGRWGWTEGERVRLVGKQVNESGVLEGVGGCTVRHSAGWHVRHVVSVVARRCCTHGRTYRVNMEYCARTSTVSDFCETWFSAFDVRGCKIVKSCGCCRFKNLKVLTVVHHESDCANEVRCNGDNYYIT
jgi:hypothetical protein